MGKVLVDNDESWIYNRWRPMMAWLYMATCAFDFMIAPVFFAIIQASFHQPITQWQPLTLQGAGLYHLAMGSILGIAAWTRTQEKIMTIPPLFRRAALRSGPTWTVLSRSWRK